MDGIGTDEPALIFATMARPSNQLLASDEVAAWYVETVPGIAHDLPSALRTGRGGWQSGNYESQCCDGECRHDTTDLELR